MTERTERDDGKASSSEAGNGSRAPESFRVEVLAKRRLTTSSSQHLIARMKVVEKRQEVLKRQVEMQEVR